MAVVSEKIDVLQVVVVDEEDDDFSYKIEARLYDPDVISPSKWLVGDCGSGVKHSIYPEEIDAYIELFNAMKNHKKEG